MYRKHGVLIKTYFPQPRGTEYSWGYDYAAEAEERRKQEESRAQENRASQERQRLLDQRKQEYEAANLQERTDSLNRQREYESNQFWIKFNAEQERLRKTEEAFHSRLERQAKVREEQSRTDREYHAYIFSIMDNAVQTMKERITKFIDTLPISRENKLMEDKLKAIKDNLISLEGYGPIRDTLQLNKKKLEDIIYYQGKDPGLFDSFFCCSSQPKTYPPLDDLCNSIEALYSRTRKTLSDLEDQRSNAYIYA
ncbi:hypothetical protein Lbir_3061 [Legionella birminghamensis]|uniref:Uncharacterized protein n=1 Tax=Legionella birminghamensis TaxID=28083 RepID=A0A378ICF8_9GAMM|nr:hypothetical protein [Legionella birminghamensis]KTC66759.1 hypothetical protein Lbir_3061 [Legionella birminghamensis]STX32908.1 Uncharacterised protein [Legionella birminghamensis]